MDLARDKDGTICLYAKQPGRGFNSWCTNHAYIFIEKTLFPEIKWEDDPVEVEIIIKSTCDHRYEDFRKIGEKTIGVCKCGDLKVVEQI